MTPNQDIDEFLEESADTQPAEPKPEQKAPVVAPPQQKFTPNTTPVVQPVESKPVQKAPVVAPPQQRFTPNTTPVVQPVESKPVQKAPVVAPPQQKFTPNTTPVVQPAESKPEQKAPVVAPPQQRFTPNTTPVVQPAESKPVQKAPVVAPPQQRFTPNTTPVVQPAESKPVQKAPVVAPPQQKFTPNTQAQKPAYIPKPVESAPVEMVKVPDVTNLNQDDARTQLERLGFKVSIATDSSTVVKPNAVISQNVRTGTEVTKGSEVKLVVSAGTWSNWSVDRVLDTNRFVVEQKKEFRFRNRNREIETHESSERNLPGYTCIDQRKVYSDWENEGYYTTENRETSETCDISTNLIGFKYCGYSYVGSDLKLNVCYSTKESALIFNPTTKPEEWEYVETVLYQDIPCETVDWYPEGDLERTTPAGDVIDCNIKMASYSVDGKRYAMKYGSLGTEWFLYHRRTEIETVYTYKREYFTEWSEWSDWSDKAVKQDELNEVEARILYRYRLKTSKDLD
jgi:hypothetical protein